MLRSKIVCLGVGCILALAFPVAGIETPLTYQKAGPGEGFSPGGNPIVAFKSEKPGGDWKLPPLLNPKPLFSVLKIGGHEYLVIADQQKKEDTFYNRIYVDVNGNHDLTDDPAIDGNIMGESSFWVADFPLVELQVPVNGKNIPYAIRAGVEQYKPGFILGLIGRLAGASIDVPRLTITSGCSYAGTVEVDGKKYKIRFCDADLNGQFDDPLKVLHVTIDNRDSLKAEGDLVTIAPEDEKTEWTWQNFCHRLVIGHSLFDVALNVPENKLVLTPFASDTAPVKLSGSFETLTMYSEGDDAAAIMMYRPDQALSLPCGAYRLAQYDALRKDDQGDNWLASAHGTTETESVTVAKAQETVFPYGEPFSARIVPDKGGIQYSFFGSAKAVLGFVIEGAGNEEIPYVSHYSATNAQLATPSISRSRPQTPTYKAMKPDGEVVSQGTFEYG